MAGDAAVSDPGVTAVPPPPVPHCGGWREGHPTGVHACDSPGAPLVAGPGGSTTFLELHGTPPGPRSRVVVTGPPRSGGRAAVWAALTSAWREAGQPLLVVTAGRPYPPDVYAAEWLAEHELCGHRLEPHIVNPWRFGVEALAVRDVQLLEVDPWRVLSFGPDDATALAELRHYDVRRVEVAGVKR